MTTKKSPTAKKATKTSQASPAKAQAPSAPKVKKAEATQDEKTIAAVGSRKAPDVANGSRPAKSKANPFTRQTQQDIQLHTSRNADQDKLVTRSFTIYASDDQHIKELTEELNKYSRKKVNNSLVIRTAINHLHEAIQKGGVRFEQDLERLIKDSI